VNIYGKGHENVTFGFALTPAPLPKGEGSWILGKFDRVWGKFDRFTKNIQNQVQ